MAKLTVLVELAIMLGIVSPVRQRRQQMIWLNTLLLAIAVLVFFLVPWPWYYAAPLALGVLIALGVVSGIVRGLVIRRRGP